MEYKIVSSCEWMYPDITEYKTQTDRVKMSALSNSLATFQILITNSTGKVRVTSDLEHEIYEEKSVMVESNPNLEHSLPLTPSRIAPYRVYDCLKTYEGGVCGENIGVYVAIKTKDKDVVGLITISDEKETKNVPVNIRVSKAAVPNETLQIVMGLSYNKIHDYHNNEKDKNVYTEYLKMLRRMHQNRMYVFGPYGYKKDGEWHFEYKNLTSVIPELLKLGFKHFHITGIGFRKSWSENQIDICGMDSKSEEADKYLKKYMSTLKRWMDENSYPYSMFSIGIADEPNEYNSEAYSALAKKVKNLFPELEIYDAVSGIDLEDVLDIWIPRSDEYEKKKDYFDSKKENHQVWQYVCLYPRGGGYINRFLDLPLLSTRLIYWGNYLYGLSGYLHWAVNNYQNYNDPFENSCGMHYNADSKTILPPGDDKLIYPGNDGPWMSIRLENQRESAEEYEMLNAIAKHNKTIADNICKKALTSFSTPNLDPIAFSLLREKLIKEYENIVL